MSESVRVVARLTARPDTLEALKAAAFTAIEATRKETGCLRYELLQNLTDALDLTFVEEWASAEALDAHSKSPHMAAFLKAAGGLLGGAPNIRRYRLLK